MIMEDILSVFCHACEQNDLDTIKKCVELGVDVNAANGRPLSLLIEESLTNIPPEGIQKMSVEEFEALNNKKAEILRYLLKNGLNVNVFNDNFDAPVLLSYTWRCPEITELLLESGADKDIILHGENSIYDFVCDGYNLYGDKCNNAICKIKQLLEKHNAKSLWRDDYSPMEYIKNVRRAVVILMGIPASGKSSFCERYLSEDTRINLDTLKTRHQEDLALAKAFAKQQTMVIDNTKVTKAERAKYMSLARENNYSVVGFFLQSVVRDCIERNNRREGTAKVPAQAIAAKSNQLEIPDYKEGFDKLYYVRINKNDFEVTNWIKE